MRSPTMHTQPWQRRVVYNIPAYRLATAEAEPITSDLEPFTVKSVEGRTHLVRDLP